MMKTRLGLLALAGVAFLLSCSPKAPVPVSPAKIFLGDYHMDCRCDHLGTPQNDSIQDTFYVHVVEIPNDTARLQIVNIHNLGVSDTADIIGAHNFNSDLYYITGTIFPPDSIFIYYLRDSLNCGGYGVK